MLDENLFKWISLKSMSSKFNYHIQTKEDRTVNILSIWMFIITVIISLIYQILINIHENKKA